jgi:sarcosine oxidase subunit gamma
MVELAGRRTPLQSLTGVTKWPELFSGDGVYVREVTFVSQVNLRVDPTSSAADRIARAVGVALPSTPNRVASGSCWSALWLGPDEWLVVGPDGDAPAIEACLREALGTDWGSIVDVSANRTVIEVGGPAAPMVLAKGCPLDLHPRQFGTGSCAQSLLAKALVTLWQRDNQPAYWIFVRASFAVYVAEWLLDALLEFRSHA